jgi:hypothetical protein
MASDVWEDLIVSILSVNRYSLEKTYSSVDSLRREGVLDPERLAGWTVQEIATRLRNGGYSRGEFLNKLLAGRLLSLGKFVEHLGFAESEETLMKSDKSELSEFLQPVNGVGPQVLINFSLLRKSPVHNK